MRERCQQLRYMCEDITFNDQLILTYQQQQQGQILQRLMMQPLEHHHSWSCQWMLCEHEEQIPLESLRVERQVELVPVWMMTVRLQVVELGVEAAQWPLTGTSRLQLVCPL